MRGSSERKRLVERFMRDYERMNGQRLQEDLGKQLQELIDRKLFHSTLTVDAQLHHRLDYVRDLLKHVLESLQDNRGDIPLTEFHDDLGDLVEAQCRVVSDKVKASLVETGLHSPELEEQYQTKIDGEAKEMKQEVRGALAKSKREAPAGQVDATGEKPSAGTRYDRFIQRVCNHPVGALLIVFFVAIIGLSQLLGGIEKIADFFKPRPVSEVASPEAAPLDPNIIQQNGRVVGKAVGKIKESAGGIVFETRCETSHLKEGQPFEYRGTKYGIVSVGSRSLTRISTTHGMQTNVLQNVSCHVLE